MVRTIGGHVISAFDTNKMQPKAVKEALSAVGRMSMPQIVATMPHKTYLMLANLANEMMTSRGVHWLKFLNIFYPFASRSLPVFEIPL